MQLVILPPQLRFGLALPKRAQLQEGGIPLDLRGGIDRLQDPVGHYLRTQALDIATIKEFFRARATPRKVRGPLLSEFLKELATAELPERVDPSVWSKLSAQYFKMSVGVCDDGSCDAIRHGHAYQFGGVASPNWYGKEAAEKWLRAQPSSPLLDLRSLLEQVAAWDLPISSDLDKPRM